MYSLFSREGGVEIAVRSPEQSLAIKKGIQRWVQKAGATHIRWEQNCLHFEGAGWTCSRLNRPLQNIKQGQIRFTEMPDGMAMTYHVSLPRFRVLASGGFMGMFIAINSVNAPRLWLLLPVVALFYYGIQLTVVRELASDLRLTAIRALADAAEHELQSLMAA